VKLLRPPPIWPTRGPTVTKHRPELALVVGVDERGQRAHLGFSLFEFGETANVMAVTQSAQSVPAEGGARFGPELSPAASLAG